MIRFRPVKPRYLLLNLHISFEDDSPSKTVEFVATAVDRYSDPIETEFNWTGAENGLLTVDNAGGTYDVTATAGDVSDSITVTVSAYSVPLPPQPEIDYEKLALHEAIAGLEERMTCQEGGHE
jgi:hypothetical protein